MPLPNPGAEWPPRSYRPVLERIAEWDAWYRGDVAELHRIYNAQNQTLHHRTQLAGGLAGWLARMWWGRPVNATEPADKLHIPVAADLATASADLLFSEPPQVNLKDADGATKSRITELAGDGLHASLLRAADVQAGLGGVYLRVVWDADVADQPWLAPVHADAAVPEWRYDRLVAVTFWRELPAPDGNTVFRHLERHEPGAILHGLYAGGPAGLGRRMALTDHPETAPLAALVNDGDAITLPNRLLTAVYVPNQMPARSWRHTPAGVNLGRSDYEGIEPAMDKLDMVWSSWMRDIDLGKGRIILPAYMLQDLGAGKGAQWDMDRRAFAPINAMPGQDSSGQAGVTVAQFSIRHQEHKETCAELLDQILRGAGYSGSTFGTDDSTGVQTATEIQAHERRSLVTRAKKELNWRPQLSAILEALMVVDREVFDTRITPGRPEVTFADSVQEDPQRLATTTDLLRRAEAASTETLVRMSHPDWDDPQVEREVAAIMAETGRQVQDPDTFRGGAPPEGPGSGE